MMHPLPFPYRATLYEQDGTTVVREGVPMAVWPAAMRTLRAGGGATHDGEGRLKDHALWDVNGRRAVLDDGRSFTVVSAEPQAFLRHTTLVLKRVRSRG